MYINHSSVMTVIMSEHTPAPIPRNQLSVSEARANLPTLLDRVAGGEEITITRHGVAVAVLMPSERVKTRRKAVQEALSRAAEIGRQIDDARSQPLPPPLGDPTSAELRVAELRAERDGR
jgi:prevent-host-death family protein